MEIPGNVIFLCLFFDILTDCIHPSIAECRNLYFQQPIEDKALTGHVIRSVNATSDDNCMMQCYSEERCVSYNLGPLKDDFHLCELSYSDHVHHQHDLADKEGFLYRAAQNNPCNEKPCKGFKNSTCLAGFTEKGFKCQCDLPAGQVCTKARSCSEHRKSGHTTSGVYEIDPDGLGPFDVFCDQTTAGGGWTVFQKRLDGSVDFYRDWADYKKGFGDLSGEFWLGLDKIHRLTSQTNNTLRVELEDFDGNTTYAEYGMFVVSDEASKYQLSVGTYKGTSGDALSPHHGMAFSTKDQDNDKHSKNCAKMFKGAWWYKSCHKSNLNGLYHHGKHSSHADGVNWKYWKGQKYSVKRAEMKVQTV